ncbi:hypothetical protein AZ035_002535, partial [Klebsiella aerogenes]
MMIRWLCETTHKALSPIINLIH